MSLKQKFPKIKKLHKNKTIERVIDFSKSTLKNVNEDNKFSKSNQKLKNSLERLNKQDKYLYKRNPIKNFDITVKRDLTAIETLKILKRFTKKFQTFFDDLSSVIDSHVGGSQSELNAVEFSRRRLVHFINAYYEIIEKNYSIQKYFQERKRPIGISSFYKMKALFEEFIWVKNFNFYKALAKERFPKDIKYKFDRIQEAAICKKYYEDHHNGQQIFHTIQNVFCWVRYQNFLGDEKLIKTFSNVKDIGNTALNTIRGVLKRDPRWKGKVHIPKIFHPPRRKYTNLGYWQFDLKIIGTLDSPLRYPITIASMKEQSSKVVYSKVVVDQSIESLLEFCNEALEFGTELRLPFKRIRTDNAMTFKKTNFVRSDTYEYWLLINGINQQHIPLNQPQANGDIERYHQTLDKEFLPMIKNCKSLSEVQKVLEIFNQNYNFNRYIFNSIYKYDQSIPQFFIPTEIIDEFLSKNFPEE